VRAHHLSPLPGEAADRRPYLASYTERFDFRVLGRLDEVDAERAVGAATCCRRAVGAGRLRGGIAGRGSPHLIQYIGEDTWTMSRSDATSCLTEQEWGERAFEVRNFTVIVQLVVGTSPPPGARSSIRVRDTSRQRNVALCDRWNLLSRRVRVLGMPFFPLPPSASWRHQDARSGFEVVYFQPIDGGHLLTGCTTAVEDQHSWIVDYEIGVDAGWHTRHVRVVGRSDAGVRMVTLETEGNGRWRVDGDLAPHLDGCRDVDLESSAMTNALPVHRLDLAMHKRATAPAAYVRAMDLSVVRLEQQYVRTGGAAGQQHYDYNAPAFDFACQLSYDEAGLVLSYPGIAVRAG
jgi:hypothetical protein